MDKLAAVLSELNSIRGVRQGLILLSAIVLALLVRLVFARVVLMLTGKTRTDVDDRIAAVLRTPTVASILIAGVAWALAETPTTGAVSTIVNGALVTLAALLWTVAVMRVGRILLQVLSERVDQLAWLQPKTLPLFDMTLKFLAVGGFLYFVCIAWNIPLASWLTSAGIVGIAVGFAAKDTLANLFSGLFIIADAPYKVGDFIILDGGLRGLVSDIGMRSTRLLTRDDVEVTVPNAVIANAQIVNETGGPHQKMRVRVKVEAAYGSDIDQVRRVLLECADDVAHVASDPEPRVRFREFGGSGLLFELLAWIDEPVYRGRVLDALNSKVYKRFAEEGIEIPYSKHDLYVKEMPSGSNGG